MLAFWFRAKVPSTKRETMDVLPTEIEPISTTFPFTRIFVNDGGFTDVGLGGAASITGATFCANIIFSVLQVDLTRALDSTRVNGS